MNLTENLRKLNSLTKYPSIETYHTIDPKTGYLSEPAMVFGDDAGRGRVIGREKIDGVNARLILGAAGRGGRDYVIGSREELLYAKGDRVGNPALGIVETLKPIAEVLGEVSGANPESVVVLYGEVFGGAGITSASKQYSKEKRAGFRLFDVTMAHEREFLERLEQPIEKIASWRDHGGQTFLVENALRGLANAWSADGIELAPLVIDMDASELPVSIPDAAAFLRAHTLKTRVNLDGGDGNSEGLVIRSPDRSRIAKLRHEDYQRTERRGRR